MYMRSFIKYGRPDCGPHKDAIFCYYTARQCSPLRRKFMECYIINPALSLLMKHLVIGQRQKAPNFSAFHWSPHGSLVSRNQEGSTFTEKDRNKLNYRIGPKSIQLPVLQLCKACTAWSDFGPGCAGRA